MPASPRDSECIEKQLLVCCARTRMPAAIAGRVREILSNQIDWSYLLAEAAENSVTPLLERHLRSAGADGVPPEQKERLKSAARANTVRCLFLAAELNKIAGLFRDAGIQAIPYKGPVLAVQAYGDLTLREFEDLDIILRQRDLPAAHEIILELGYLPRFPWIKAEGTAEALIPGEYNYRDEARRVMVEIHTEFTLRHFPVVPNLDDFTKGLVGVKVGGGEVTTFAAEDALVLLCIHGAKDFWERLSWIADISELVQAHPDLDWDRAIRRAEALNAQRMVFLGLNLAADVLDATLPGEIARKARADAAAVLVAREVEARLLSREMSHLDAAGRFHFRRRMISGGAAGWRYAIRLSVAPAEEDWGMMRLPRPLAPLYVALRPLRLLHKYGWTSRRAPHLTP